MHFEKCAGSICFTDDMQMPLVIAFVIVIVAWASGQRPNRPKNVERFNWFKKLTTVAAMFMALLIVINPEFYVLGLLGDGAFFDLLVLALSLQLQNILITARHCIYDDVTGLIRWLMMPRPTFQMLLLIFAPVGTIIFEIQRTVRRIFER